MTKITAMQQQQISAHIANGVGHAEVAKMFKITVARVKGLCGETTKAKEKPNATGAGSKVSDKKDPKDDFS